MTNGPDDVARLSPLFDSFGRTHCDHEPVYAALCALLAREPTRLTLLGRAEPPQQRPNLLLAAIHFLVRKHASAFAAYFPSAGGTRDLDDRFDACARAFLDEHADSIAALCATRTTQTNEIGRCAVLWPALLEGARLTGARDCAIYDFGASAGLNLGLDTYGLDYDELHVRPGAEPRISCHLDGPGRFAVTGDLRVVERLGFDPAPVDLRDVDARDWLLACVWPHDHVRRERLEHASDLALRRGFRVEQAADCLQRIEQHIDTLPAGTTPVVLHSWVLNYIPDDARRGTLARLRALVEERGAIWISGEGNEVVLDESLPPCPPVETQWVLTWPGGRRVVAHSHPHGTWLRWLTT